MNAIPVPSANFSSDLQLADWLELAAFFNPNEPIPIGALNTAIDIETDAEPDDLDAEANASELRIQDALRVLQERSRDIGDDYPFLLVREGAALQVRIDPGRIGHVYIFCLVVSNLARDGLVSGTSAEPSRSVSQKSRDLFQICATLSGAGFVNGPSFSVGHPRVDKSSFIDKLKQVYAALGDGEVVEDVPTELGASASVKDDRIDVVSFRRESGTAVGTLYILGQAAAGANWSEKSLVAEIRNFHDTWFKKSPATQADAAIYIPHDLSAPELAKAARRMHRVRTRRTIPGDIRVALRLHSQGCPNIERVADIDELSDWLQSYRSSVSWQ